MSKISLKELRRFPELYDYLQNENWQFYFTNATLSRGKKSYLEGNIFESNFELLRVGEYLFRSVCSGSGLNVYQQVAYFKYNKREKWSFQTHCTCPVGDSCKHVAALLYAVVAELKPLTLGAKTSDFKAEFDSWLSQLTEKEVATQKKASPNQSMLAYCLYPPSKFNELPHLKLHTARTLKSGEIKFNSNSYASPKLDRPPKYLKEEDFLPVVLYQQLNDHWNPGANLNSKNAYNLLIEAEKTQRLFLFESDGYVLDVKLGDDMNVTPTWRTEADGSAVPELDLPPNSLIIPTEPPLVLSVSGELDLASLHLLKHEKLTSKQLLNWEKGPKLSADDIQQASELLAEKVPSLPAPISLKNKKLKKTKPVPCLHLRRKNPFTHRGLHLSGQPEPIIATLSYEYHGEKIEPNLSEPPPTDASFSYIKDGTRYTITRDVDAELGHFQPLFYEHNLRPSFLFDPQAIHPDHHASFLPNADPVDWDFAWADFFARDLAMLREAGWQVTVDPSAELTVLDIEPDAVRTDLAENPDHGIDWFQFQASYLTPEGKQQALLPLLGVFLENTDPEMIDAILENLPKDDKTVLRDPENPGIFLAFPSTPLYTLAKSIFELFGENSPETPIHRLQAAAIADSLELDSSQTLKDLAALGHNLKNITSLPRPKIPAAVKAELRDYQREGFYWMQFLARHGLHGILADDMGLGKTLQTLTHLQAEVSAKRHEGRPSLVIAPTSVAGNWKNEAAKFTPKLKVLLLHGAERHEDFSKIKSHDLVLTTYPLLVRDFDELVKHNFHLLVLDEAQYIKNPAAKAAQSACKLKAAHRLSLSGTPIENHLGELWSQMRFLMPGLLGSSEVFRKFFRTPIEKNHDSTAQKTLNQRVAPLILRRTKEKVTTELPPKTEIIHQIPLNKKQIDFYETIRAAMDSRIREAISAKGLAKSQIIVLDALLKLRQICCHPQLLKIAAAKKVKDSAKLDFLTKDLLPTLLEEKRKILLFSSFTSMLSLIEAHLVAEKIPFAKITGQTKDRQTQIDQFQESDIPIFLISLKAGGTGLNLTAADTVIHYDPWWNPAAENQATDRAYRIGQDKPVFVHKLICEGTIEQRIQDLQSQKSALVDALFTEDTSKLKIDQSTLQNLLAPIA